MHYPLRNRIKKEQIHLHIKSYDVFQFLSLLVVIKARILSCVYIFPILFRFFSDRSSHFVLYFSSVKVRMNGFRFSLSRISPYVVFVHNLQEGRETDIYRKQQVSSIKCTSMTKTMRSPVKKDIPVRKQCYILGSGELMIMLDLSHFCGLSSIIIFQLKLFKRIVKRKHRSI